MEENNKNITIQYSAYLWMYWTGFAALAAFASMYLLSCGLSNSAIGVVISLSSFIAAILQPPVGSFVDRSTNVYNRHLLITLAAVAAGFGLMLCVLSAKSSTLVIGLIYGVIYFLLMLAQPFTNALGIEYINAGHKINFGLSRAMGSLGYAVAAYITGLITAKVGPSCIPLICVLSFAIMAVVLFFCMPGLVKENDSTQKGKELIGDADQEGKEQADNSASCDKPATPIEFIKKYPVFMIMLLGLVCIYYTHTLINTYALQIYESKTGVHANVGYAASLAAALEMLPMIFFPVTKKYLSLNKMIKLSAVFFTLKIIATLIVQEAILIYIVQILQIGGWGVLAVSLVFYVNEVIEQADSSQGQAYAGMAMTLGTVTASLICGRLLDVIGVNKTLVVGIVVGIVGTIIIFLTTPEMKVKGINE